MPQIRPTRTAISATFEVSKMPSQRMNSGTQASEGIARLGNGTVDVGGVGVGHRLHDDRRTAAVT
ncbi:hypothetical protein [Bradyrhizobium sp. 195]|nr:hypothetical protein IVB26_11345 [Bradyrhizobium sp. 195]